jgi:hypothetical protein
VSLGGVGPALDLPDEIAGHTVEKNSPDASLSV